MHKAVKLRRPEFWMGLLLAWVLLSALRASHTPWAHSAEVSALRWAGGIGLALALGMGLRGTLRVVQAMTVGLGALAAATVAIGRQGDGLVVGPYGDHQLCASALLALLPFSAALAVAAPRPLWRWVGLVVALTASVCLVLTQGRAAWMGTLAGGVVFALLWRRRTPSSPTTHSSSRAWAVPIVFVVASVLAIWMLAWKAGVLHPLSVRAATFASLGDDSSWQWRLNTWRGAIGMIAQRPLTGWGAGCYPVAHWQVTHTGTPIFPGERPSVPDQAHDLYLQTVVDFGFVGLALYLMTLFTLVQGTLCARGRSPDWHRAVLTALLALLAGQGVDALGSPSWQFASVSLLFWAGVGVGLAEVRTVGRQDKARIY